MGQNQDIRGQAFDRCHKQSLERVTDRRKVREQWPPEFNAVGDHVFTIDFEVRPHWVDFTVWRREVVGDPLELWWASNGCPSPHEAESNPPVFEGHVRWDGCTEWSVPDPNNNPNHQCDLDGLKATLAVVERCYVRGLELILEAGGPLPDGSRP